MPMGSGNLGVGPVPVCVEARGGDWTVESNTLPMPGRSLVGTRSVYLLANSELLSNTIDDEKGWDRAGAGCPTGTDPVVRTAACQLVHTQCQGSGATPIPILCRPNAGIVAGAGPDAYVL